MKTKSCKAKGRKLQQYLRDTICKLWDFPEGWVRCTLMGETGPDVTVLNSQYKFECKNTESLNIWAALEQTERNAGTKGVPVLVFKRNRSEVYAVMKLDDLLPLLPLQENK